MTQAEARVRRQLLVAAGPAAGLGAAMFAAGGLAKLESPEEIEHVLEATYGMSASCADAVGLFVPLAEIGLVAAVLLVARPLVWVRGMGILYAILAVHLGWSLLVRPGDSTCGCGLPLAGGARAQLVLDVVVAIPLICASLPSVAAPAPGLDPGRSVAFLRWTAATILLIGAAVAGELRWTMPAVSMDVDPIATGFPRSAAVTVTAGAETDLRIVAVEPLCPCAQVGHAFVTRSPSGAEATVMVSETVSAADTEGGSLESWARIVVETSGVRHDRLVRLW